MTPDQSNPAMKYMPYIMPVFLLFFFNGLPSALTWYYSVSNLITLCLQFVIQTLYHRSREDPGEAEGEPEQAKDEDPNGRSGWSRCRRPRRMRRKGRRARRTKENSMIDSPAICRYCPALLRAVGAGGAAAQKSVSELTLVYDYLPVGRRRRGQRSKTPSTPYILKGTRAGPR